MSSLRHQEWEIANRHRAMVFWLTGLSGAGKTTIACAVQRQLIAQGCRVVLLDGDELRQGLCQDLGFSPQDRSENIRRAGALAQLLWNQGNIVLCSFISPYAADRLMVRDLFPSTSFHEIYVSCPVELCRKRDPKGLYKKQLAHFTGLSAPYEAPVAAELVIATDRLSVAESIALCTTYCLEKLSLSRL